MRRYTGVGSPANLIAALESGSVFKAWIAGLVVV